MVITGAYFVGDRRLTTVMMAMAMATETVTVLPGNNNTDKSLPSEIYMMNMAMASGSGRLCPTAGKFHRLGSSPAGSWVPWQQSCCTLENVPTVLAIVIVYMSLLLITFMVPYHITNNYNTHTSHQLCIIFNPLFN